MYWRRWDWTLTKYTYKIIEVVLVVLLIGFVAFLFISNSGGTKKRVKEIAAPVLQSADFSALSRKTAADAAKVFGFDTSKEEGILYYANDDIMDCSELLIVKLKDEADAAAFQEAIEARVQKQKNLFQNYAPDQYALLKKAIIETSGNTVFYCTSKDADAIYDAFKKAL